VNVKLTPYLPGPIAAIVDSDLEKPAPLYGLVMPEKSIGRLKAFHGNVGMFVRAYTYIRAYGGDGLREVSRHAVLNANYIRAKLHDVYTVPYDRYCAHEFVMEGQFDGVDGVHALDVSKRLMDYDIHPPTNYFPLIVPEALLIEPTETEDKATLDAFIDVMKKIAEEAKTQPDLLKNAPHTTEIRRVDEVRAAKQLVLCCRPVPEWEKKEAAEVKSVQAEKAEENRVNEAKMNEEKVSQVTANEHKPSEVKPDEKKASEAKDSEQVNKAKADQEQPGA
jgi:glycine dehydrogenase subunit 2